ncbi:MAG: redoxin domain-containing protein [Flavobacteriaceae bacterium]
MKKFFLLTLFSFTIFFSCKNETGSKQKTTVLIGEVIGRPYSSKLSLNTKNKDSKVNTIEIPIINGKFKYTLKSGFLQEFEIAFNDELAKGSWQSIDFFNDKDTIRMTLFEREKSDLNVIHGGIVNYKADIFKKKNKILFWDKISNIYDSKYDSLQKINQWNSKEITKIYTELQNEKDLGKRNLIYKRLDKLRNEKKDLTPQARVYQNKIDILLTNIQKSNDLFIKNDKTILGFSMLMNNLYSNKYNKDFDYFTIVENLEEYQKKFKEHPYSKEAELLFKGIVNSKIGGDYIDFSSKKFNDEIIKVSPIVEKNSMVLIDLWAPWCGPCIAKSKKLKPEYKRLKDKGLEVFAVIGRIDSKEKYITTKGKYNYPWQVNYELNDEFNIWSKYNISNSGGSQFLIDSKGKILAINPEPEEIDSILNSMIKVKL